MLDLIRLAYGYQADKIYGGPTWLEMSRYNVTAKVPPDTNAAAARLMLQTLLEERFALKTHKEDKPLPTLALTLGKSPKLKEGDNSGETGCKPQSAAGNVNGPGTITFSTRDGPSGAVTTIRTGPDSMVTYACRNVSMASFVNLIRTMIVTNLGPNPIPDETGLKGVWSFDLSYTMGISLPMGGEGKRVSINDAIEKQLGLKLEKREIPTPVLVVDKVNETPTPNAPGIDQAFPPVKLPTEFEVASVKMADPLVGGRGGPIRMSTLTGGRLNFEGVPLTMIYPKEHSTMRTAISYKASPQRTYRSATTSTPASQSLRLSTPMTRNCPPAFSATSSSSASI